LLSTFWWPQGGEFFTRSLAEAFRCSLEEAEALKRAYTDHALSTVDEDLVARSLGRSSRAFEFPQGLLRAAATVLGRAEQLDRLFGSLRVNDEKLRRELGWSPPFTLEQGLQATSEWYRAHRKPS